MVALKHAAYQCIVEHPLHEWDPVCRSQRTQVASQQNSQAQKTPCRTRQSQHTHSAAIHGVEHEDGCHHEDRQGALRQDRQPQRAPNANNSPA